MDSDRKSINPTQKPVVFWRDMIESMPTVRLVIDLFAGTGSAASAAVGLKKYVWQMFS